MKTKGWARPIETTDYANVVVSPVNGKQDQRKIDHFEDGKVESGYKLTAKVRMTFAGLRTRNQALYLPDEMYRGMRTFVEPFHRPILPHHDEERDPIGRVIDVRYIDTANELIARDRRIGATMAVFKDRSATKKHKLKTVETFLDLERDEGYMGVGHIYGLWELTDPDAIVKALDRRYLTVSTSFTPEGAHCSSCAMDGTLTDWRTDECDHVPGKVYDGYPCVAVPYGFAYDHVSPVNDPAAIYARIVEVGTGLTFADAIAKVERPVAGEIFSDVQLVKTDIMAKFQDSQKISPENSNDVIGNSEPSKINLNTETPMPNISDLTKDSASNYDALFKFLPEGSTRLTGDLLSQLAETDFAGPRRTFLCRDADHIKAGIALLETVEDSENKTLILTDLQDRLTAMTPPSVEGAVSESAEASPIEDAVAGETETAAAEELVQVGKDAYEGLVKAQAELLELKDSCEILKAQLTSAKKQKDLARAENEQLLRDYKVLLAETLVDKMVGKGFAVKDRAAKVLDLKARTIESLKDSLRDLDEKPASWLANQEPVRPSVKDEVETTDKDSAEQDRARYKGVYDRYEELFHRPNGERLAATFWREQQLRGLIPLNMNP